MPKRKASPRKKSGKARARRKLRAGTEAPRRPLFGSLLLFWPIYLWHFLTRDLQLVLRWPVRLAGDLAILAVMAAIPTAAFYHLRAKHYDLAKITEMPERSIILDRNGRELGRIHGEKRAIVPLSEVSPSFRLAILAREDERFMRHHGVDWIGVGRAALRNIKDRGVVQGASTITMQLARNTFPLKSKLLAWSHILQELDRKALEIAVAQRIEGRYSKDEILENYVNRINWGHSIMGIEEASRIYFEKHASELTLSESALLAGIVRGPDAFSPFKDINKALRERNTTLARMVAANFITEEAAEAAKAAPGHIRPKWRRVVHGNYAMDAIRRDLEMILEKENIALGGLTIHTTIDSRIQLAAEEALDHRLREIERTPGYPHQTRAQWRALPNGQRGRPQYIQGGAVVIESSTGAVLAVLGGRNADESKFNRAIQAKRQIGSIFKPFVYLAAFDAGLRPNTWISDDRLIPGEIKGAPRSWSPHNSDGKFRGLKPVSYGLIHSRNTMSVRVGNYVGIDRVRELARQVGFGGDVPRVPASYLGSWEASPWDVASAYTIFPNLGERYRPFLITEIRDREGNVKYSTPPLFYRAARAGSAWSVSKILQEVTVSGTAARVKSLGFDKPCAGKTGTTDDYRDAWFSGYTTSLTCAVWVGFDTPKRTIDRGYGSTLALPVWAEIMKTAVRLGYPAKPFKANLHFTSCELCRLSGKRATQGCRDAGTTYVASVPADIAPPPNDLCPIHPARAQPVEEAKPHWNPFRRKHPDPAPPPPPPARARPVDPRPPLRARPVAPPPPPPLRALPVE